MRTYLTLLACLVLLIPVAASAQSAQIVPQDRTQIQLSFAPVVKKIAPAVVSIYTKRIVTDRVQNPFLSDPFFAPFFQDGRTGGLSRQRVENSLGSGVIVQQDGLIVTNAHVVGNAQEIVVALFDGREIPARIVLIDKPSDLALLRLTGPIEEPLPVAPLKPSETLEVGDLVIALGNPFGVGQTVTSGIVSALARSSRTISDFNFFIQTDAAINPGNSGGPLVDMDGTVVGINTAIYSKDGGSLGIGFAIPSEMVATVIAAEKSGQTRKSGGIVRPWLGVSAQDVTQDIADSLGLRRPEGALISRIHPASPALQSGLATGDVVISVNGHPIRDAAEMRFRTSMVPLGQSASLGILRKGQSLTLPLKAVAPPEIPARSDWKVGGTTPLTGATVANINPALQAELGLEEESGVVIATIARGSIASQLFLPGEIVLAIGRTEIDSVAELRDALTAPAPQGWVVTVSRNGQPRRVIIR